MDRQTEKREWHRERERERERKRERENLPGGLCRHWAAAKCTKTQAIIFSFLPCSRLHNAELVTTLIKDIVCVCVCVCVCVIVRERERERENERVSKCVCLPA